MSTPDALRIALIKLCGWTQDRDGNWIAPADWPRGWRHGAQSTGPELDANLVSRARGLLVTTGQKFSYVMYLGGSSVSITGFRLWNCINAPVEQHAEAVLRALNAMP